MTQIGLLIGIVVGAVSVWRWSSTHVATPARLVLVSCLGTAAAAFNLVVPVASVEATTLVTVCVACVLGVRAACATGIVAVVASSVGGGVGVWTLWQIVAVCMVAALATALTAPAGRTKRLVARARIAVALGCAIWDVVVTAGGLASYLDVSGPGFVSQLTTALLLGAPFSIVHVATSVVLCGVVGTPLLDALQRVRPRLDGGIIIEQVTAELSTARRTLR